MIRIRLALLALVMLTPIALSAQQLSRARVGLSRPAMAQTIRPLSPSSRRAVEWKKGAIVGFVIGAAGSLVLLSGGDEINPGVVVYMGLLGALVGALGQAMFSGS